MSKIGIVAVFKKDAGEEFLARWLKDRELKREWAVLRPFPNMAAFQLVNHDAAGNIRLDITATRVDRKDKKYDLPAGVGSVIYAPQPDTYQRWASSREKWLVEGDGGAIAMEGLGIAALAFRGCHCWHLKGKTDLHPMLADIRKGDAVNIGMDGDWRTNKSVHRGAFGLMQALRNVGARPYLVDVPAIPGAPKPGIDDAIAYWRRIKADPLVGLHSLDKLEEIPTPYPISLRRPYETAESFILQNYWNEEHEVSTLVRWNKDFFTWSGCGWVITNTEIIRAKIYEFLDGAGLSPTKPIVANIVDALMAVAIIELRDAPAWRGDDAAGIDPLYLFACSNGLLDLQTQKLHPPTPQFFNLNYSSVAYDPSATSDLWQKFVGEIYPEDRESAQLVQEFMGYTLTEDTSIQKILMMAGEKRSGKGTIANIWEALLGSSSCAGPTLQSLGKEFGLQSLIGKKLALISDSRIGGGQGLPETVGAMLRISGGDTVSVARKNIGDWIGKLRTRFCVQLNNLPSMLDEGGVFASRHLLLDHKVSFYGREDPNLTNKLLGELSGILNWSLAGLERLAERGRFVQPDSGKDALEELERRSFPVKAFVEDCCVIKVGSSVPKDWLYSRWKQWLINTGREKFVSMDASKFATALYQMGGKRITPMSKRVAGSEKRLQMFQGVSYVGPD